MELEELCPGCMKPVEECTGQFCLCVKRVSFTANEMDEWDEKKYAELKGMFIHLFDVVKKISPGNLTLNECDTYKWLKKKGINHMKIPKIRWNTKLHILQITVATIGMVQLLNEAYFMALLSVMIFYGIGTCENGGHISNETTE